MGVREALLAATTPTEVVQIPEIGLSVIVRGMTGAERDSYVFGCMKGHGKRRELDATNMSAKLVAFCCIDEGGKRVFSDEDVVALGQTRADVIDRLYTVAQRLSGLRQEDTDELGQTSGSQTASSTPRST